MKSSLKASMKSVMPSRVYNILRVIYRYKDLFSTMCFLFANIPHVSFKHKVRIVKQLYATSQSIDSPHTQDEILTFIRTILTLPSDSKGAVVEAGCFKGSSTAKFSLAADIAGRNLVVFDSFEGIPENHEPHSKSRFGAEVGFRRGDYCGTLEEVKSNVMKFGKINRCRFIRGWFHETMPEFNERIAAVYIDVDLVSSTRDCVRYLYPLLEEGGALLSQDGHLPLVLDVLKDEEFWLKEVGCNRPPIHGLGKTKLIKIIKKTQQCAVGGLNPV